MRSAGCMPMPVCAMTACSAGEMHQAGYTFGVTENQVWCTEEVPAAYIARRLYAVPEEQSGDPSCSNTPEPKDTLPPEND